jgi:hypothetical protein
MKEQELRALVRDAVARHLGDRGDIGPDVASRTPASFAAGLPAPSGHASHAVYINLINADDTCVIEPAVRCNHCNYCRSHGH